MTSLPLITYLMLLPFKTSDRTSSRLPSQLMSFLLLLSKSVDLKKKEYTLFFSIMLIASFTVIAFPFTDTFSCAALTDNGMMNRNKMVIRIYQFLDCIFFMF